MNESEVAADRFMNYVAKFNKNIASAEEYEMRFANWLKIDAYIEKVNAPGSEYTHTAAHNKFSDWTPEEKAAIRNNAMANKSS